MSTSLESSIERVQRAVARAVFASTLCAWLAGILLGTACLALFARAAWRWEGARAAWMFAPLVAAPLVALWASRQKQLSRAGAAAWLDLHSGASGMVVTGFETGAEAWRGRVGEALQRVERLPAARLRRSIGLCALALAFAAAALFVPIPREPVPPAVVLQEAAIGRVEEQLATLEEEVTLAPEFADEMRESLERLKEDGALENAESTLEAADRASERLVEEAEAAAQMAEQALGGLGAAEAGATRDPEAAQKELEAALEKLALSGLGKGLAEEELADLGLDGLEVPQGKALAPGELQKIARALEGRLGEKLARLAGKGLLKDARSARAGRPGEMPEFEEHVCTEECRKNPGGT